MIKKSLLLMSITAIIMASKNYVFANNHQNEKFMKNLYENPNPAETTMDIEDELIPREVLFGNPDKISVQLSSDGKYISYLAPLEGVLNIFIAPANDPNNAKAITKDKERGIRNYIWAKNNRNIIFALDNKGDENFRLYSIDVQTLENTLITPEEKIKASVLKMSYKFPSEILIKMNNRVLEYFDIYRVNIITGNKELIFENKSGYSSFIVDDDFNIRGAYKMLPDGQGEIYLFKNNDYLNPELFQKVKPEDMLTTSPLQIRADGMTLYLIDSNGRDKSALFEVNLATRERQLIYEDERADIDDIITEPVTKKIQGVAVEYMVKDWVILDKKIKPDIDYLKALEAGDFEIISRNKSDDKWVVVYMQDDGPYKYYLYDRSTKEVKFLFVSNSRQEGYKFAKMNPVEIIARDGLKLVSYLTLPRWLSSDTSKVNKSLSNISNLQKPIPLVLYVHGGPNARDRKSYNATHQWLANRGYAVLSVNYRGSTGFGKSFINSADGQWARKMQDDLEDAVKWAINQKITDKDKVVIMGGSYGGYATLVGITMTPDLYAAGIDIVGPSNLETLMNSIPPYWKPVFAHLKKIIGASPEDEKGKKFLRERSPLTFVQNINKPLLIVQGAHDPRVKQAESDQIVSAMKAHGIPVVYLLYKDEGHGLARPENRMSFYAIAEMFLANILKGRYINHEGNFPGSSMEIIEGKELTWIKEMK